MTLNTKLFYLLAAIVNGHSKTNSLMCPVEKLTCKNSFSGMSSGVETITLLKTTWSNGYDPFAL